MNRFHSIIAAVMMSLPLIFLTEASAMQNPIYSGVNRVEFSCKGGGTAEVALCAAVKSELESRFRMPVKMAVGSDTKSAKNQISLGVLNVALETSGKGNAKARLIWTNSKRIGPKPTQIIGDWLSYNGVEGTQAELENLAADLVDGAP